MVAYEQRRATTLEGVVTEVRWTNPHMFVFVDVPTKEGKTENWSFEGGAITSAVSGGLSPKRLKVGTKVKISGRRHLDPTKHMALLNDVEIDGKVYGRNGDESNDRSKYKRGRRVEGPDAAAAVASGLSPDRLKVGARALQDPPREGPLQACGGHAGGGDRRSDLMFDGLVDFDAVLRDPQHPARLLPAYDVGNHFTPNEAGSRKLAEAIDLNLFRK